MALQITDSNFNELANSGKPMVLDFWAEWCGPCRMVSPIIDELAAEYEGRVIVGKMDVDSNDEIVGKFGVRNIPTVIFIKDGKVRSKNRSIIVKRCTQREKEIRPFQGMAASFWEKDSDRFEKSTGRGGGEDER